MSPAQLALRRGAGPIANTSGNEPFGGIPSHGSKADASAFRTATAGKASALLPTCCPTHRAVEEYHIDTVVVADSRRSGRPAPQRRGCHAPAGALQAACYLSRA